MTDKEREWLQQLHDKLARDADVFSDPRYNGIWESIIDKYSDQAHFVYELLQNADDAGATWVRFELHSQELVFRHNGKKLFTVSNPETEAEDQQNGKLGHVNAIAAIGMSQKLIANKEGNQIGKFGVGFKSVFRYTNNPRIYDDNIWFRFERRIVPSVVAFDYCGRQSGETIFVFPFDSGDVAKSYSEVANKVRTLQYPLLFLRNLMEIQYRTVEDEGTYSKECSEWTPLEYHDGTVNVDLLHTRSVCLKYSQERLNIQQFSRCLVSGEKVSVGYFTDTNGCPIPKQGIGAFCFFQTDVPTGLNFIVHAPFLLTDNRQGIKDDSMKDDKGIRHQGHNERMIDAIAKLAADAIWAFTKLRDNKFTEDIVNVIPSRESACFSLPYESLFRVNYGSIRSKFIEVFRTLQVIPSKDGYSMAKDCIWPFNERLNELLSGPQIEELFGCAKNKWAFASYPGARTGLSESTQGHFKYSFRNGSLGEFLFRIFGNPKSLSDIICVLTSDFVQGQTDEWRKLLYERIVTAQYQKHFLATKNLLLNQAGQAMSAYDQNGREQLWLPTEGVSNTPMVKESLMQDKNVRHLTDILELKHVEIPSRKKQILDLITDTFTATINIDQYMRAFKQVFDFWRDDPQKEVIAAMKKVHSLYTYSCFDHKTVYLIPDELYPKSSKILYFNTNNFSSYLADLNRAYIVMIEEYVEVCGETFKKELMSFLKHLGVHDVLMPVKDGQMPGVNFCRANFERFLSIKDHNKRVVNCKATWNLLLDFVRVHCKENRPFLNYMMYKPSDEDGVITSSTLNKMREVAWIIDSNGDLRKPSEIHVEDLDDFYTFDTWPARQLAEAIGLKRITLESLSDSDRASLELGRRLKAFGIGEITEEDIEKIKRVLSNNDDDNVGTTGIVPSTTFGDTANISLSDGQYAGLSRDRQHDELIEAKMMVMEKLRHEGFVFTKGICEDDFSLINGVRKGGEEYPLVVHSYKDSSRPFQLNAADWKQLMRRNSMLMVRTHEGICAVPFKVLVCNREKIEFSISTQDNLELSDRITSLAHIMRWFKGLRFDFGSLIPMEVGTAQLFDLPENPIPEDQEESQKSPDSESEVF